MIDISWPISNQMTTYKNKNDVAIEQIKLFERDGVREHRITMGMHTGTHIDSLAHFLQNGVTIEQIALEKLVGPCRVLDLTHVDEKITIDDLKSFSITAGQRILLKTKNSALSPTKKFETSFVYLDKSGAQYLAEMGVNCVGIDYLGIERDQPDHESHLALLECNVPIIEGLRLAHVEHGSYQLYCFPLYIPGAEAAPARAILGPMIQA